jgi:hypothetical protein
MGSGAKQTCLFACLTALREVGLVLSCTLIANMRELGSLSRHQAAALGASAHSGGTQSSLLNKR